jgi:hypothetical protein
VNASTSGTRAHLALAYYYYPNSACTASSRQLDYGFVSSANGGSTWRTPTQLSRASGSAFGLGSMRLGWLPTTTQGVMVADYISTSFDSSDLEIPALAVAQPPSGGLLHQAMYSTAISASGGSVVASQTAARTGANIPFVAADNASNDRTIKCRD